MLVAHWNYRVNPVALKSDQKVISPYNIGTLSTKQLMR